tara:strand:- start:217 stop:456 length:240 start_codon:yes stop_codon:yes gene_type:complete
MPNQKKPPAYSIKVGDKFFSFKTKNSFVTKLRTLAADMGQLTRTPSRRMKDSDAKIMSKAMKNASNRTYRNVLKIKKSK